METVHSSEVRIVCKNINLSDSQNQQDGHTQNLDSRQELVVGQPKFCRENQMVGGYEPVR